MDGEGTRVAHVGDVGDDFQVVDERLARGGGIRGLDAEDHDTATLALQVLDVLSILGVALEAGIAHPSNLRVRLEMLGDLQGILAVTVHAERQGLDAL